MAREGARRQNAATAFHEAGHAVVAFKLGVTFGRGGLSIEPNEDSAGRFSHSGRIGGDPSVQMTDRMYCNIERQVMVCLAGIESQRRHRKSSVRRYHSSSDYQNAVSLLFRVAASGEEMELWLKLLRFRVRSLISSPMWWFVIERLAEVLLERRSLSRRDAEDTIRQILSQYRPSL